MRLPMNWVGDDADELGWSGLAIEAFGAGVVSMAWHDWTMALG
jgi:hypothetical protein